jgi:CHASE2 domain-containing sensor protein
MVRDALTGRVSRLAGVGFLSAAVIAQDIDLESLACSFPASHEPPANCTVRPIRMAERIYEPATETSPTTGRIQFLLPYEEHARGSSSTYGYNPAVIDTVEALNVRQSNIGEYAGAVVVIGGSYYASNDLHVTPLGSDMPGAMVHANAIRAYATNAFIVESKSWSLKLILIGTAALIGATFHVIRLFARCGIAGDIARVLILFAGVIIAAFVVFLIGLVRGFAVLAETGTALGTLTPVLAVLFEGLCGVFHELKRLGNRVTKHLVP